MSESNTFGYPHPVDYFGSRLFQICHLTANDLHNYKMYDRYAEMNLARSVSDVSEELHRILEKKHESEHEDISDFFAGDFNEYGNIFPYLHRKSMMITLFNFYEHQIETLCHEVNKLLPKDMTDEYFKGTCLKSFRIFLHREAGFNISQGEGLWGAWEDMLKVEQIRHVLVHSEGEVDNDKSKPLADIRNYCNRRKHIRLFGHKIIIGDGFVAALIKELIRIFELLAEQSANFVRRYINEHGSYDFPLPPRASRTPL